MLQNCKQIYKSLPCKVTNQYEHLKYYILDLLFVTDIFVINSISIMLQFCFKNMLYFMYFL